MFKHKSTPVSLLAGMASITLLSMPATGQVSIGQIFHTVSSFSDAFSEGIDNDDRQSDTRIVELNELPLSAAFSTSASAGPYAASGSAESMLSIEASSDRFSGSASGGTTGMIALPAEAAHIPGSGLGQQGGSSSRISFTVEGGPAVLTATGTLSASGDTAGNYGAQFRLLESGAPEVINLRANVPFIPELDVSGNATINVEQTLMPGNYQLAFGSSVNPITVFGGQSGDSSYEVTFEVIGSGGGSSAEELFWSVNNGRYDDEGSWEPMEVPGDMQTAIFDRDASYTVTVSGDESERAVIERGTVTFSGSALEFSGGSVTEPSLEVGRSTTDRASLNISVSNMTTLHAEAGGTSIARGSIEVPAGAQWANSGRLTVGRAGEGSLSIRESGTVSTSELRVGGETGGEGTVTIERVSDQSSTPSLVADSTAIGLSGNGELSLKNARVETGSTEIASGSISVGTVTILESPNFAFWTFDGPLIVANEGIGTLDIFGGGTVRAMPGEFHPLTVANASGSVGTVRVDGAFARLTTDGLLHVGRGGEGILTIENGGVVSVGSFAVGPLDAAFASGADGEVLVQGSGEFTESPHLLVADILRIGNFGRGVLTAEMEARIECAHLDVGSVTGADGQLILNQSDLVTPGFVRAGIVDTETGDVLRRGTVTLIDGTLEAGTFLLRRESRIEGVGTIIASGSEINGTVSPGATLAKSEKQNSEETEIGSLRFEGDLTLEGATLILDAAGLGEGQLDVLVVTGSVDMANTTLRINLREGYLPRAGDAIPFLVADGGSTIENLSIEYTGADDGFMLELVEENGMLMVRAQNDAQMDPVGGEGEGEGEGEGNDGPPLSLMCGNVAQGPHPAAMLPLIFMLLVFVSLGAVTNARRFLQ